jgi:hypothetical protein
MDVDDVVAEKQYIHLLRGAEVEVVHADEHLEYIQARSHPPGMVGGGQLACDPQQWSPANQKLQRKLKLNFII